MTRLDRRTLLAGLGAGLLGGCAASEGELSGGPGGLAGDTPRAPAEGGIGGTGIVGIVTALGSVRINGLRVGLAPETLIADAFGPRRATALRPGMSLTLEAAGPADRLVARRVRIDQPLIGRIGRMSRDGRVLRVLGVRVLLEPGVNAPVETGDRVAVSGLWRGREVVASRIDRLGQDGPSVIAGEVGAAGRWPAIAGVTLALLGEAEAPAPGTYATAVGEERDGVLVVSALEAGRFTGAAGPLERLSVEGYLEPVATAPGYAVSGLGHSFDPAARLAPLAGTRAVFAGPYTGDFAVETALPLPDAPNPRARLLSVAGPEPLSARPGAVGTR